MPVRIQRSRAKGWRMPSGAIYVGRPTQWGNPFRVDSDWIVWAAVAIGFNGDLGGRRQAAVALYRAWLTGESPAFQRAREDMGAIGYGDGRVVPTSEHVMGFAGTVASLMRAPTLPVKPDLQPLRGKPLACFCALNQPCHADVLLELANV